MPRGPRLDTPGTLHHVILRGIEQRRIVDDDLDRENFINRLGRLAEDSHTSVYAWALLDNHAHILMRSGPAGISAFMRSVLTGYAVSYNLRHHRHGHLFQNRYKSIVCEEDAYFMELVRYIHLNPLRAGIVDSLAQLDRYPWCGHCVVMAHCDAHWQDRDYVLTWFGKTGRQAKRAYREFVKNGIAQGKRPELVGGGLIRSLGGWSAVKSLRRSGDREKGDSRILGSSEFVMQVIDEAEQQVRQQLSGDDLIEKAGKLIHSYCVEHNIAADLLCSGSRRKAVSKARKELVLKLVKEIGLSLAETGRQLGLTTSGVAQILRRNP